MIDPSIFPVSEAFVNYGPKIHNANTLNGPHCLGVGYSVFLIYKKGHKTGRDILQTHPAKVAQFAGCEYFYLQVHKQ